MDVRVATLQAEGPAAFAFLVADHGFAPPETVAEGLRYTRPGLTVEITAWTWNRETGFSTRLCRPRPDGGRASEELADAYVRLGLGPARDVGSTATTGHTVRKRIGEHAAALAAVLSAGTARGTGQPFGGSRT